MPAVSTAPEPNALLRHTLATLAYRAGKAVRGAPADFAGFKASPETRTPVQILAHMGDLFDWALALADGRHDWHNSEPLPWDAEVQRFFNAVAAFDRRLASAEPLGSEPERLFSGPIADALTHTGQIAMLRRMAGAPIRGENYFKADIAAGRVGTEQPPAVVEFD
ncbi:MAG TPA: hypothetical protein VFA04_02140 [Bryobacteraceae bacterium]|nr:hypothetical protein [Bryobacteraceae bacterium]